MYSHNFLVTSVRGIGLLPMTAASAGLGVIGFMKAALGLRLAASLDAGFFAAVAFAALAFDAAGLAADDFAAGLLAAALAAGFLAAGFFAAGCFAVAIR